MSITMFSDNNIKIWIYWFYIDVSLQETVLSVYLCTFIDISLPALSHFDLLSCTKCLIYKPFTMCSYQIPSSKIPPDIYTLQHFVVARVSDKKMKLANVSLISHQLRNIATFSHKFLHIPCPLYVCLLNFCVFVCSLG